MNKTFSNNLKRFRLAKNYTQEQVAEMLQVSAQTVSRWECGSTLPDAMTLPEIARLYCITIDDLYKETSVAYENYAQRLASIYEATREPEDFLRADMEFQKLLKGPDYSTEDLRIYGILHHFMMNYCRQKALSLFDRVLEQCSEMNEDVYWRTKHQKMLLHSQIGKGTSDIHAQLALIEQGSENVQEWICLIAAYHYNNEEENAYKWFQKAIGKFSHAALYIYGGNICKKLKKYEEAFAYWDKALELDDSYCDAKYSKAFTYEEMGEYAKAYDIWCEIVENLKKNGLDIEAQTEWKNAQKCREKLKTE